MGFLDKAKQAAEQAANRANETVADVQAKRELTKAYAELGETAYRLVDAGTISQPELEAQVTRIRALEAKRDEDKRARTNGEATEPAPTEAVEQPLSGAGPGAS